MIASRLSEIDEALLQTLCVDARPESETLDYKRDLPANTPQARSEFLKDVCAMANAKGGDLCYGIAESNGTASELAGIVGGESDAAKRRLGQMIESSIEPRLYGLQFHIVQLTGDKFVLIVRVPASFNGPHRYRLDNGNYRFVVRSETHTHELNYQELRSAFDQVSSLAESARRFREARIGQIIAGSTGRRMMPSPLCVIHVIPIGNSVGRPSIDTSSLRQNYRGLVFSEWHGGMASFNLDGLIVHPAGGNHKDGEVAYVQVFRSGLMEAVRVGAALGTDEKLISAHVVSRFFRDAILKLLNESVRLGLSGPAIVAGALVKIGAYSFAFSERYEGGHQNSADRENLIFPEIWIERLEGLEDADTVVRPFLDILWQSFNFDRCNLFDEAGNWLGDAR